MRRTLVAALLPAVLLALCVTAAPAPGATRTVPSELDRLVAAGKVDAARADRWKAVYADAARTSRRLTGARRTALGAVVRTTRELAASRRLTASRAPAVFLTLERNRVWWASRPLVANGYRTRFAGSQLVWQHYAGEGLHIQWLATFGRANALFTAGKDDELRALLDEALALASARAGGQAFEHLFRFGGGRPPWVSGLAQGTAVQALSRGAVRLGDSRYFEAARAGLAVFRAAPPEGIRVDTDAGAHFLIYSYARDLRVLNAFVQSLNGLWDFAGLANDAEGRALFAAGEAELRRTLGRYDTGAWSRYSTTRESDLGYHKLVRDFLRGLCTRLTTGRERAASGGAPPVAGGVAPVAPPPAEAVPDPEPYCAAAQRFTGYLTTPPEVAVVEGTLREARSGSLRFTVDKPAVVQVVARRRGKVVLSRVLRVGSGRRALAVRPSAAGPLAVTVVATDLAGNRAQDAGVVRVRPKAKR